MRFELMHKDVSVADIDIGSYDGILGILESRMDGLESRL